MFLSLLIGLMRLEPKINLFWVEFELSTFSTWSLLGGDFMLYCSIILFCVVFCNEFFMVSICFNTRSAGGKLVARWVCPSSSESESEIYCVILFFCVVFFITNFFKLLDKVIINVSTKKMHLFRFKNETLFMLLIFNELERFSGIHPFKDKFFRYRSLLNTHWRYK
jgi:hypothetical protein